MADHRTASKRAASPSAHRADVLVKCPACGTRFLLGREPVMDAALSCPNCWDVIWLSEMLAAV